MLGHPAGGAIGVRHQAGVAGRLRRRWNFLFGQFSLNLIPRNVTCDLEDRVPVDSLLWMRSVGEINP
jgi:hypothetical protein